MEMNLFSDCQFRYIRTRNALVQHLYENANMKRRRNVTKTYDECITGMLHFSFLLSLLQFNNNRPLYSIENSLGLSISR